MKKKLLLPIILLISLVLLGSGARLLSAQNTLVPGNYIHNLAPLPMHQKADRDVLKYIQYIHYLKPAIDDRLSSKVMDNYLSDLDPQRGFFMASDTKDFEFYRNLMDDVLRTGDMKPPFWIYNRYQERMVERLIFGITMVEAGVDKIRFDQDLSIDIDRKNDPWPKNRAELEGVWRRMVMNDVLNLLLDDKSAAETQQTLSKRYRSQLARIAQTNSEDVFQIFMNAFCHTFDPHTEYFSPRSSENFSINMSLSLEGIGAMLGLEDEYVKIVSLVPAGPADKSGQLKPDDRIVAVGQGSEGDLVDVVGWRLDDVVDLIRGPKETLVRLKVIPGSALDHRKTKIVPIMRNTVRLEEQAAHKEIIDVGDKNHPQRIGIIIVPTFYQDFNAQNMGKKDYRSTTRDVMNLINELKQARVEGIVIDLRDNGGGSLQEADMMTGLFIDQGPVVQIRDANKHVERLYDDDPQTYWDGPLAVVVNRLSASASEIFAGAIQDYGRGVIIGEDTFGKGSVQKLINLDYGQLKLTSDKFYRISGGSTQNRGIQADISYPSLYDKTKIGESILPAALPWDQISPAPHRIYNDVKPYLPRLRDLHQKRMGTDPDYLYTKDMLTYLAKIRADNEISLNRSVRVQEDTQLRKKRLELENTRRSAKGLPLLKSVEALLDDDEDKKKDKEDKLKVQDDPVLIESSRVLSDLIMLGTPVKSPKSLTLRK
jgi:carboxyl-terminal processing protease